MPESQPQTSAVIPDVAQTPETQAPVQWAADSIILAVEASHRIRKSPEKRREILGELADAIDCDEAVAAKLIEQLLSGQPPSQAHSALAHALLENEADAGRLAAAIRAAAMRRNPRPISWVKKHWRSIRRTAAAMAALAAAGWAVVELAWPTVVAPLLTPGQVEVSMHAETVARTDKYVVESLRFEVKNAGQRRMYVPANYFLARGYKIVPEGKPPVMPPSGSGLAETGSNEKRASVIREALTEILKEMPPDQRAVVTAEASNTLFMGQWSEDHKTAQFERAIQRGSFRLDPQTHRLLAFGRLPGTTGFLDPGESVRSQVVVVVPAGYDVLIVDSRTMSSVRDVGSNWAFVGTPFNDGIAVFPVLIDGTELERIKDPKKAAQAILEPETQKRWQRSFGDKSYTTVGRFEFYVGEGKLSGTTEKLSQGE